MTCRLEASKIVKMQRLVLDFTRGSGTVVAHIFYILFLHINRTKTGDHGERGKVVVGGREPVTGTGFWCCTITRTKGKAAI
jgi:hypothetical protein